MELTQHVVTPATHKFGTDTFAMVAGKSLRIETTPGGVEVLDEECPPGKAWAVRVIVEITETDV